MTPEALEVRLEEWARWAQLGGGSVDLGYGKVAPGFSSTIKQSGTPQLQTEDRPAEVEAAVSELQARGAGIKDGQGRWIRKPLRHWLGVAEVIRAEYRAHPMYGHPDYDGNTDHREKTLKRLGISSTTYWRRLSKGRDELLHIL